MNCWGRMTDFSVAEFNKEKLETSQPDMNLFT